MKKRYAIPFNENTRSWDEVIVTARVINKADKKVQKLKPDIKVEDDARGGGYPAIKNNVLLVGNTSVDARIEAGDHAQISLRLNDGDPKIHEIVKRHSRFGLKVTLYPELDGTDGKAAEPGVEVEGFTQVYVQLPQTWDLTFRKTLWNDDNPIDLKKVDGMPVEELQALGDWGGRLILKPVGLFQPEDQGPGERILSTKSIADAGECSLDRGDGKVLAGTWDQARQAYIFQIEPSQSDEAGAGEGARDLEVTCHVEMHKGWEKRFQQLMRSARVLGKQLDPSVTQNAKTFIRGYLDFIAATEQAGLVDRKEHIRTWVLNLSDFITFMEPGVELFNKSLSLFDSALDRFVDNIINFTIELCFALIDVLSYVYKWAKGTIKQAVKGSTKELVEELAERTTKELASQREVVEHGIKAMRENIESLDSQLATLRKQWPTDLSDPSPELLSKMDDLLTRMNGALQERNELMRKLAQESQGLADLEANIAISQYVKSHSGEVTEKEFLEKLKGFAGDLPESDAIQRIVQNVEAIQTKDLGRVLEWGDSLNAAIKNLPADAPDATRRELNRLLSYWAEFTYDVRVDVLKEFNKNVYTDMLAKQPLGQRLKKIAEEAKKAKAAAEKIRYENVAWEHYKGFFSPLWWFIDWSIAKIAWLYDWAKEYFPWLADAETWLAYAIDTFLQYFMGKMNAVVAFTNSNLWTRSSISVDHRGRGEGLARAHGVGDPFFLFPKVVGNYAKQNDDPKKIIGMGSSGSQSEKEAVKRRVEAQLRGDYSQEKNNQIRYAKQLFSTLCQKTLDPGLFLQEAPERLSHTQLNGVWHSLASPMDKYEEGFREAQAQGSDYLASISRFKESATFQDLDGAIEWIAWAVAWTLRLGSLLAIGTGVGAAAVPTAFAVAQGVEWAAAALRPAVVALGTMPDIVGFQFDIVIAASLAHAAATKGGIDPSTLVVPSYYVE